MHNATDAQKENENVQQPFHSDVNKELLPFLDNTFVKSIHGDRIYYRPEFYVAMYKRITEEKMTYVEAYESLGFDCNVLGETRALQAGKNTMQKASENKLFTSDPVNYDGSVPLDSMPDLSLEEQNAYMVKRIIYLEAVVEAQKKIQSVLEENCTL